MENGKQKRGGTLPRSPHSELRPKLKGVETQDALGGFQDTVVLWYAVWCVCVYVCSMQCGMVW